MTSGGTIAALSRPTAAVALACVIWGGAPVALRFLATSSAPVDVLIVRSALEWFVLLPLAIITRPHHWPATDLLWAGTMGLVGAVGYAAPVTIAAGVVPAGVSSVLLATETLWIAVLGQVVLRERMSLWPWLGLACGAVGVVVVAEPWEAGARTTMLGAALVVLGAAAWAAFTIGIRPLSRRHGAVRASVIALAIGQAPYVLFVRLDNLHAVLGTVTDLLAMAWLVVGSSLLAIPLWNFGLA